MSLMIFNCHKCVYAVCYTHAFIHLMIGATVWNRTENEWYAHGNTQQLGHPYKVVSAGTNWLCVFSIVCVLGHFFFLLERMLGALFIGKFHLVSGISILLLPPNQDMERRPAKNTNFHETEWMSPFNFRHVQHKSSTAEWIVTLSTGCGSINIR